MPKEYKSIYKLGQKNISVAKQNCRTAVYCFWCLRVSQWDEDRVDTINHITDAIWNDGYSSICSHHTNRDSLRKYVKDQVSKFERWHTENDLTENTTIHGIIVDVDRPKSGRTPKYGWRTIKRLKQFSNRSCKEIENLSHDVDPANQRGDGKIYASSAWRYRVKNGIHFFKKFPTMILYLPFHCPWRLAHCRWMLRSFGIMRADIQNGAFVVHYWGRRDKWKRLLDLDFSKKFPIFGIKHSENNGVWGTSRDAIGYENNFMGVTFCIYKLYNI